MKLIFSLTANNIETFYDSNCIQNWDQVKCAYKRAEESGVVRSFTSAFEFVGDAYEQILRLYVERESDAECKVAIYTLTNNWVREKRFESTLDFSTFARHGSVITISAIDNSVAAVLKSNKTTTFEMAIGTDIKPDATFYFDRIPMKEMVEYEFTKGESEDDGTIRIDFDGLSQRKPIWLGCVADEVSVGGHIFWNDDQDDDGTGYCLKAIKDTEVKLSFECTFRNMRDYSFTENGERQNIGLNALIGNEERLIGVVQIGYLYVGEFATLQELKAAYPHGFSNDYDHIIAMVKGVVWLYKYTSDGSDPEAGGGTGGFWNEQPGAKLTDYQRTTVNSEMEFTLHAGEKVIIVARGKLIGQDIHKSSFRFEWISRGNGFDVDAFTIENVANKVAAKLCDGHYNAFVKISDHDPRIANTLIMAAESYRELESAKFYSSFNDFCDWMSVVFGYTYTIGDLVPSPFTRPTAIAHGFTNINYPPTDGEHSGLVHVEDIVYNKAAGMFMLADDGYWYEWLGSEDYNDPATGKPRTDCIFKIGGDLYYFTADGEKHRYEYGEENIHKDTCVITFVHRSELFDADAPVKDIEHIKEASHSVNNNLIYSSVEVGYLGQDYDSINGRDEFNFSVTYTTGHIATERKLTMQCRYRADAYGMEFAAQKRGEDTTDNNADNDVFFVYTRKEGEKYYADRTIPVDNTLTHEVFNGIFSPMACIKANEGYIGVQAETLTLKFASSLGNSDVTIDGHKVTDDIVLNARLFRPDELAFKTNDIEDVANVNELVRVVDNGIEYVGFLREVELNYGKAEAASYKLIIKEMTI